MFILSVYTWMIYFRPFTAGWRECVRMITEALATLKTNGQHSQKLASTAPYLVPTPSTLIKSRQ